MSARFPPKPPRRPRRDDTLDLDATLDVYQEHTADLRIEDVTEAPHPDMMATSRMEAMPPATRSLADTLQQQRANAPAAARPGDQAIASVAPNATTAADITGQDEPPAEDVTQLRGFSGADAAADAGTNSRTGTVDDAGIVGAQDTQHGDPDATAIQPLDVTAWRSLESAAAAPPPAVTPPEPTIDAASLQAPATPADATTGPIAATAESAAGPATPDIDATSDRPAVTAPPPAASEQQPALAPGNILLERYLLEQVIGCGGTAIVFRARDLQAHNKQAPNAQLAIKTPRPELGDLPRATVRLQHEFEHARRLHHPNIVEVLEFRREAGQPYMVMQLIEGRLLSRVLRERAALDADSARHILRQCAAALKHAHEQEVVHGDFKPGNVFIGGDDTVTIVDFGAAATPASDASRIPAGTPTYASPEVLQGQLPQPCDDVFSFACVAYEALAGQHPFERLSSLQAREEKRVPPRSAGLSKSQWVALVAALSWNRQERPTDISQLIEQLFPTPVEPPAAVAVETPPPPAPTPLAQGAVPRQRHWGFVAFLACILIVTVLALRHRSGSDEPPAVATPAPAVPAPVIAPPMDPLAAGGTADDPDQLSAENAPLEDEVIEIEDAPVAVAPPRPRAPVALSEISFASSRIVTTESSFAAVFVVNRSAPLNGRVTVNWRAVSGTATAGEDFIADAGGTIVFADNQAQRAIYVPLINDTLAEGDETFTVVLEDPRGARLGELSTAEAVIRDDD